jgi:hypothetical protein
MILAATGIVRAIVSVWRLLRGDEDDGDDGKRRGGGVVVEY